MSFKWIYPLWFVLFSATAIFLVTTFSTKPFVNYVVLVYIVFCFIFTFGRLMVVLIRASIKAKAEIPDIYQEHVGFSSFGSTRLLSPSFVFDNRVANSNNPTVIENWTELKYLYLGVALGFFISATLIVLTAI